MGKQVSVQNENVHHLISQAYDYGGPYQWAREGMVNSLQANAKWVHFGVEEQGFSHSGVARRFIADDGIGMNEEDLRLFLSSFGGGGRTIGQGQNFGQGFKSSCYQWNPYGIIVASWTPETPDGRMIWIHRQVRGGNTYWELNDFEIAVDDDEVEISDCIQPTLIPDIGVDIRNLKFPEIEKSGHGTVFLFLGDSPERDTVHGDYLRDETKIRGIIGYLNTRFIDVPDHVSVTVSSMESKASSDSTERRESKDNFITDDRGRRKTLHSRRVRGVRHWIRDEGTKHGSLIAKHGTKIEWYLTDQDDVVGDSSYRPAKPLIMVKYEDEAYNVKSDVRSYRMFGIPEEVRNRVWMVIEPPRLKPNSPEWGVTPQASRGTLTSKGDVELPWHDWQDHFYNNMPEAIRDAIADSRSENSAGDTGARKERLKRITDKFGSRWKPIVLVQNNAGRTPGDPANDSGKPRTTGDRKRKRVSVPHPGKGGGKDTGAAGNRVILNPSESGEAFGSARRKSEGIPEVVWDKKFSSDGEQLYAARFDINDNRDGSFGTVHLNASWPMFQTEMKFWTETYPRASYEDVEEVVRSAYEDEVVSKVMHAYKLRNTVVGVDENGDDVRILNEHVESFTSPEALTTAVMGLTNVESKIRTAGGSKFGPANTKKRAAKSADKKGTNEAFDLPV